MPSGRPSQEGRDRRGPGGGGGSQRGDDRRQSQQQAAPPPAADRTPVNVSALQKHLGAGAPTVLGGRRWGANTRSTGGDVVGGNR